MVQNLFQFISLFLLANELTVSTGELLLVKKEQLNLQDRLLTINHHSYKISEEAAASLVKVVTLDKKDSDYLFIQSITH